MTAGPQSDHFFAAITHATTFRLGLDGIVTDRETSAVRLRCFA